MALVATTLSAAVTVNDTSILVASATSVAVDRLLLIDGEFMKVQKSYVAASTTVPVVRGWDGTVVQAHPISARVIHGDAPDFSQPSPATAVTIPVAARARPLVSYSASGAIALPKAGEDQIAFLNGTNALSMTLANPTTEMNGAILYVASNGAAAHTVTYTAGLGNAGGNYDVLTWNGTGLAVVGLMAVGGYWCALHTITGTLTNIGAAIA